jgi:dihydroorotate dehydrogenase
MQPQKFAASGVLPIAFWHRYTGGRSSLGRRVYRALRNLLFLLPPEMSHTLALRALALGERLGVTQRLVHGVYQPVSVMGLKFRNRIGLAAGLDKSGRCIEGLLSMGFGFVEVGTVTPRPQPGNASPRLFRLVEHQALINRMGFNNDGIAAVVERVGQARQRLRSVASIIGINIGKNRDTVLADATHDYLECLTVAYDVADYVTVNVSSPNTPGLRNLQEGPALRELLTALCARRAELQAERGRYVPLAAKVAPDLAPDAIAELADVLLDVGIDACIATNTTTQRPLPDAARHRDEPGGLSGVPLHPLAVACVGQFAARLGGRIPIIGVGGIHDVDSGLRMLDAGATLVQVYTGFIYQGPRLVRDLARALGAGGNSPESVGLRAG